VSAYPASGLAANETGTPESSVVLVSALLLLSAEIARSRPVLLHSTRTSVDSYSTCDFVSLRGPGVGQQSEIEQIDALVAMEIGR